MVSKGSSQNMGVFGIVNSHEARLMKPLGKPQKRSYSMPGKTSYPQSPWCLQYLAGDFQQQIWDEWSTPTIVFGMGWSHQPRPQNIPMARPMIVAWFSCWRVWNLLMSFPVRGINRRFLIILTSLSKKSKCVWLFSTIQPHWNPLQPKKNTRSPYPVGMPQEGMEWFGDLPGTAGNGNLPTKPQWMWEQKEYQRTSHPHQLLEVY